MKIIKKNLVLFFLLVFQIISILNIAIINYRFIFYNKWKLINNKKKIIIEIDIYGSRIGEGGPAKFVRGMKELLPYNTSSCSFISSEGIYPINGKNKSDYFYLPFPLMSEAIYNEWINVSRASSLIIGPCFVPSYWNSFPNKNIWKEKRFREIITTIKGLVIHSNRVKEHLSTRSNTTDLNNKFIVVRACTNLMPKYVNSFENRTIDIIFFEKYPDLNRRKQGAELLSLFNSTSKNIKTMRYGNYTKEQMIYLANNTKFIIYFSFFDTGAIGLKEIQNHGVFAFSHQKDLVIDKRTSFYIPELANENDMKPAFININKKIEIITNNHPNSQLIAEKNQKINKCQNALDELCKAIIK
jgi:hypothetical protein